MKLSATLDLTPIRAAATRVINDHFSRMSSTISAAPLLHAAKLSLARSVLAGGDATLLESEAVARKLTPLDLANLIVSRSDAASAALLRMESVRQMALLCLEKASSQQEIESIKKHTLLLHVTLL